MYILLPEINLQRRAGLAVTAFLAWRSANTGASGGLHNRETMGFYPAGSRPGLTAGCCLYGISSFGATLLVDEEEVKNLGVCTLALGGTLLRR